MLSEVDPRILPSKTQARAEAAVRNIPKLVTELEAGARPLDARAVEALYKEYRAFHRSSQLFRSSIGRCQPKSTHLYQDWTVSNILEWLRTPELPSRQEALSALYVLWLRLPSTASSTDRAYALSR